ncbi:hypothetical protein AWZ03_012614 [Drosophila navojoa]|uniref:Uncharacterized protein n=1 Tax=Drosophila navojoa TaxID=7232 RepID=A0A484AWJ1_DRONA|nr:uncharacterized protein LOC108657313 [Drosophila navojoa]TDG40969.1 hypothetical protein AWZ03_012614 [Drosophila navojoa]
MSEKDNRSRENRKNMKQHKYYPQSHRGGNNTSSSSPKATTVRSIVDVADSSDEPRFGRKGWSSGTRSVAPQKNRNMLDTLPPSDSEDVDHLVDGAPIDESARAQLRAGDYKQMSQFPSMGGGHFTFGVEKEWSNIAEGQAQVPTKAASGYFTLNLSLLNCGLQTIPFYKRMDYSPAMFTRSQIIAQNEAAEQAELIYQELVLKALNDEKSRVTSAKSTKSAQPAAPDELDELLAVTDAQLAQASIDTGPTLPLEAIASPVVQPATPTTNTSKNDVEQWLDSVLDE